MSFLVDIVGVAGFVLSLFLAVYQFISNRLSVKLNNAVLIDSQKHPNSIFLFICLSNRTKTPFSLIDIQIDLRQDADLIPIEKTVRTYKQSISSDKAAVKPVVLSPAFPVRFDSYASEVFVLEVLRQHIDIQSLPLHAPAHNLKERIHKLFLHTRTSYTPLLPPRLVLNTSRGRRAIDLQLTSIESWNWLRDYAIRKAAYENKLEFPS